jgi:asparaginyl-tRNA synthetase
LDFVRLQPPIITSSDCEGGGEVFSVSSHASTPLSDMPVGLPVEENFFKDPKFLTVSSQLHLEAFVHEHQKVWSLSPTFRAEKSDTSRHLAEFWMLEAEIQTESLAEVMDLVESMTRSLISNLQSSKIMDEIICSRRPSMSESARSSTSMAELIHGRWNGLMENPWPRVTYFETMQRLQRVMGYEKTKFMSEPSWSKGLHAEHERFIVAEVGQGRPVFVTGYPSQSKPFYVLPSDLSPLPNSPDTGQCFDLLLPDVCEVVGGSLREHRFEHLRKAMVQHGLVRTPGVERSGLDEGGELGSVDAGSLEWYLDLRRFGSIPHGGFGLGLDRLISYLAGVHSVKDVVAWPRWHGRCDC